MSVLKKILSGGTAEIADSVGTMVDKIFTSDDERLTREEAMLRIENSPYLMALELALADAKSGDKFTRRARPLGLYVFWAVFGVQNGIMPVLWWFMQVFVDVTVPPPPTVISVETVTTVIAGILGLGWITGRTVEKTKGV